MSQGSLYDIQEIDMSGRPGELTFTALPNYTAPGATIHIVRNIDFFFNHINSHIIFLN